MDKKHNEILTTKEYIDSKSKYLVFVDDLADIIDISVRSFEDNFKYYMGLSPKEYLKNRKIEQLTELIKNNNKTAPFTIYYYARELGYSSASSLCSFVKKKLLE